MSKKRNLKKKKKKKKNANKKFPQFEKIRTVSMSVSDNVRIQLESHNVRIQLMSESDNIKK